MAISEVCKFELKARVDKVQKDKNLSRHKAVAALADELGLLVDTARKMDQRARKELGQIVPTETSACNNTEKECNRVQQKSTANAVDLMDKEIEKGETRQGAAKKVAEKTGKKEGSLRVAHQRAEKKKEKEAPYFTPDLETEDFNKAFVAFYREVSGAKIDEWKYTSKETCLKRIESLEYQIKNQ